MTGTRTILCSDYDEQAWKQKRLRLLTASDMGAWVGVNPWATKEEVLQEKRDGFDRSLSGSSVSSALHGKTSEAHNLEKASKMLGLPVVGYHYLITNSRWPHLGATLDALGLPAWCFEPEPAFAKSGTKTLDTYGQVLETIEEIRRLPGAPVIVEMKSTDGHNYKRKDKPRDWVDAPPDYYVIQTQVQMHVADVEAAVLCAQLGAGSMTAWVVYRAPEWAEKLDAIDAEFAAEVFEVGF